GAGRRDVRRRDCRRGARPAEPASVQGQREPREAREGDRAGRARALPVDRRDREHGGRPADLPRQPPRGEGDRARARRARDLRRDAGRSVAEILLEMCSLTDGCTMSAKKDSLVNIGGWIGLNDPDLAAQARNLCVVYEGLHTYGGLAGRDLEAIAIGIEESVDDDHVRARILQVRELGEMLEAAGVPIVEPIGGHAVFLDAKRIYPHIPQEEFPAQRLAGEIYLDSGTRTMERGIVSAGRDPETGEHRHPALELVRLTIPRRVYTSRHLAGVARSVARVFERRWTTRGLEMVFEPTYLRFFQARFRPLES